MDTTAEDLFDKLRGRFPSVTLGEESGETTLRPQDASFFEFDYTDKGKRLGSVVISLVDEGYLKLYFDQHMLDEADEQAADTWYGFLKDMSKFAHRNMLNYEAKNISKSRLDKKDFQYLRDRYKSEEELTMESKLYGSKQKSYQDLNGAKLIVQHTRTVDEEKHGSRSRNIRAIYIENSQGERFKFENNYLPGARAMARHVANEGYPIDERGKHISEIMAEMNELRSFVRSVRRDDYVNEDAREIIEAATARYYGLKDTLTGMSKQRGYADYFENWAPSEVEVDENDINDLKQRLTRTVFDDRLEGSLGAVGRAMKLSEKKQGEFFDWNDWVKSAKQNGAKIIGDINHAVAVVNGKEIGEWNQEESDVTGQKIASSYKDPGYGEINMDGGDRGEGPEREYTVPTSLDLMPGDSVLKTMRFSKGDKVGPLAAVLRDIAGRSRDDETSVFAADMATKVASIGTTFGKRMDEPGFKDQYMKAIELAKLYLAAEKGKSESVEQDVEECGTHDPFSAYVQRMDRVAEGYTDSEELADMVMASIGGEEDLSMDDVYRAVDEVISMGDDEYKADADEIAQIVIDRLGITEAALDEEPNEGNKFTGALEKAKEEGDDEFEVDGKKYKVEGHMSDIDLDIRDMIEAGASDEEIMAKYPVATSADVKRIRGEVMDRPGEYDESIDKLRRMAGIGSNARSNHGLREGEPGYQITPRSIVARQMRKLQDIERG